MFTGFVAIFIFPTVKDGIIPEKGGNCSFYMQTPKKSRFLNVLGQ